jgi:hypothetical protein
MKWVLLILKAGLGVVSWHGYETRAKCARGSGPRAEAHAGRGAPSEAANNAPIPAPQLVAASTRRHFIHIGIRPAQTAIASRAGLFAASFIGSL